MNIRFLAIISLLLIPISNLAAKPVIAQWHTDDGSVVFSQAPPANVSLYGVYSLKSGSGTIKDALGTSFGSDGARLNKEAVSRYLKGRWLCHSERGSIEMDIDSNGQVEWIETPEYGPSVLRRGQWDVNELALMLSFISHNLGGIDLNSDQQAAASQILKLKKFDGREMLLNRLYQNTESPLLFTRLPEASLAQSD